MPNQLSVAIRSTSTREPPVLLPTLVRTLEAVQKVALQIGEMLNEPRQEGRTQGQFTSEVRAACEFMVRDLRSGSAEARLEVRPAAPALFDEGPGLGERMLATLFALTRELTNGGGAEAIAGILPSESYRPAILGTYKNLCPTSGEQALVALADPDTAEHTYELAASTRSRVQLLVLQPNPADTLEDPADTLEERQIIGRLVMLESRPHPKFGIEQRDARYECPYNPDTEQELLSMYDSTVLVRGVCRVIKRDDADDEVLELRDIGEITFADDSPLVVDQIDTGSGPRRFAPPLRVEPDLSDDLYVFAHHELGIAAHGETREEAEEAFREELGWLWTNYVEADDAELSADAIELKRRLLGLCGQGAS